MKIEDRGVDITGVPGVEWIRVTGGNVEIQFPPTDGYPLSFTPEELAELHQAIGVALERVRPAGEAKAGPRVFSDDDPEPDASVTQVKDREGDIWVREGSWWHLQGDSVRKSWKWVTGYAPLTEVAEPVAEPRVFTAVDPEPDASVTQVKDREGGIWTRRGSWWHLRDMSAGESWRWLTSYAPLTEVLTEVAEPVAEVQH